MHVRAARRNGLRRTRSRRCCCRRRSTAASRPRTARSRSRSGCSTSVTRLRTQVAIVGAGPAGLILAALLHRAGIESVVLEDRSREYVEARIRAGVLEQGTVELLERAGVAERLHARGDRARRHPPAVRRRAAPRAAERADRRAHHRDLRPDRGRQGPDRRAARRGAAAALRGGRGERARLRGRRAVRALRARRRGAPARLRRDRRLRRLPRRLPAGDRRRVLRTFAREYPYGWLGILADVAPSSDELVYAHHPRGFALLSLRSPTRSRLYLQCAPDEDIAKWPDDRIWEELQARTALDGWTLKEGPVLEKGVTGMRSFVAEPMQHGRLFLAGDAAHIVPPTGAKGLNLAAHDVRVLADALIEWYATGSRDGLDGYSTECLRRVWRAEHFSWWMTSMLHNAPGADAFDRSSSSRSSAT